MASNLEQFVQKAKSGDKQALETVVSRIQNRIYGLALRMLGRPDDAEDETQEILIKIITHLSDFREESAFSSWVYRVACNHLLITRKRNNERTETTFELLEDLISSEAAATPFQASSGPEQDILLEEVRLGCMQGVLTCLERELRIAFILGEVFGVTSGEGAYILGITSEAFRKRLSRGRKRIQQFMLKNCGLVNANNPCRCERKTNRDRKHGSTIPISLKQRKAAAKSRSEALSRLKELSEIERVTALFHSYPEHRFPDAFTNIVKDLIDSGKYRIFAA